MGGGGGGGYSGGGFGSTQGGGGGGGASWIFAEGIKHTSADGVNSGHGKVQICSADDFVKIDIYKLLSRRESGTNTGTNVMNIT
eukprot:TRINITY_DN10429_c0_g1_i1.p1 TRINITY_DN10429_c0_g1~~TRINITY_DN10429_c0_g1_i1.p1  ORF type:complete len:84 (+),score=20.19 TRINITY_DN10429_c0_g1_i1:164-415(+)